MKEAFSDDNIRVVDDFLPFDEWNELWLHFQLQDFTFINGLRWLKNYRFLDGRPLTAPGVYSDAVPGLTDTRDVVSAEGVLCRFSDRLQEAAGKSGRLLGHKGTDWVTFSITPFAYPAGTALSWHDDYTMNAGSYIYYTHPEWSAHWGGELMVTGIKDMPRPMLQTGPDGGEMEVIGPYFDSTDEGRRLVEVGLGVFVTPKPNRLVIIGGGVQHCIKRVETAAGDRARCSFAGFFVAPDKVEKRKPLPVPKVGQ